MNPHTREEELRTLLLRALEGGDLAYEVFLRRLAAHLRSFLARRMHGCLDEVEDLVQECLLALHNQRHTYQRTQPLTAWVHAIAKYKLIDLLRGRSHRETLHDPLDDVQDLLWTEDDDARDSRVDLNGLLETLPDRHRLPIVHVKIEG